MILVGQYDSPYVRRVAISLKVSEFHYEHDTRSVFGDFDSMCSTNPLGRIPSLVLASGETLIDSGAILDWLDEQVGSERALLPHGGPQRRDALRRIALATGAVDKFGAANYERLIRPSQYRWPEWIERCLTQGNGALTALESLDWPTGGALDQAQITTGCMINYLKVTAPDDFPAQRFPALDALWQRLEQLPAFRATSFEGYAVPRAG
ncbi:MAG: glutathione S-transferase [Alphaproteobacteria bacterium]|nr:glutathione S-transferase [Alphaproteobacteria bacterium]